MKKIIFSLLFLTALSFAEDTKVPNKFGVGARIAIGYGFIWGLEDDWTGGENDDNPAGLDFDIGAILRYEINHTFHFTPELAFRYGNFKQDDSFGKREFTQMDIQIPILLRANASPKFYGYLGPQIGLHVGGDVTIKASNKNFLVNKNVSLNDDIKSANFNFGFDLGLGYYVMEKLSLDFSGYLGITELYPNEKSILVDLSGAKMLSFKVGASYWIF